MNLKEMLERLSSELEVKMPSSDPQKNYILTINPSISIAFRELPPGFALFSPLSNCPTNQREDLFVYLLRANFLGQGTGGARIGLDANEKVLTLSVGFPYEMNYAHFKENVEYFVNYVIYWRDEIAKFEREN
jgi:hypothetical protein